MVPEVLLVGSHMASEQRTDRVQKVVLFGAFVVHPVVARPYYHPEKALR